MGMPVRSAVTATTGSMCHSCHSLSLLSLSVTVSLLSLLSLCHCCAGCVACECSAVGSVAIQCDEMGACRCKPNTKGANCDQCSGGFYGLPDRPCEGERASLRPIVKHNVNLRRTAVLYYFIR